MKCRIFRTRPLRAAATALLLAGAATAHAAPVRYDVSLSFNQVVYDASHPDWDTFFTGSFLFDSVSGVVSELAGTLTQAMTGNTQSRELSYQLASVFDEALGGYRVSTFLLDSTDVFQGGGFATGGMKEFGNQNAYVTLFVNAADPTAALTDAQSDTLAYGDCTSGSLMGASPSTCMTGWIKRVGDTASAGGTMRGTFPVTQSITAAVPEPGQYALLLGGLGLLAGVARRRGVR